MVICKKNRQLLNILSACLRRGMNRLFATGEVMAFCGSSHLLFGVTVRTALQLLEIRFYPLVIFDKKLIIRPLDRDFIFDEFMYCLKVKSAILIRQRDCYPLSAGSCRPTDPVNIILCILGQIIVDNVRNSIDMQPPGSNIGCYHDRQFAAFEIFEYPQPLSLIDISGDDPAVEIVAVEAILKELALSLGIDEDHRPRDPHLTQQS